MPRLRPRPGLSAAGGGLGTDAESRQLRKRSCVQTGEAGEHHAALCPGPAWPNPALPHTRSSRSRRGSRQPSNPRAPASFPSLPLRAGDSGRRARAGEKDPSSRLDERDEVIIALVAEMRKRTGNQQRVWKPRLWLPPPLPCAFSLVPEGKFRGLPNADSSAPRTVDVKSWRSGVGLDHQLEVTAGLYFTRRWSLLKRTRHVPGAALWSTYTAVPSGSVLGDAAVDTRRACARRAAGPGPMGRVPAFAGLQPW